MSLEHYAYRVAGPIDFVINLLINGGIPLFFLWEVPDVPVFGVPSLFIFMGPMVFFVLTLATFFGHLNGVIQRGHGLGGGPLPPDVRWTRIAWKSGLILGLTGLVVFTLLCLAASQFWPALRIPALLVVLLDGFTAAIIGYFAQVRGVLKTKRL